MDFRSLTRRDLQALCKKNNIPANITNASMADALEALDVVEGIDDFLEQLDSETAISLVESLQKLEITSQSAPRTSCRTAKRIPVKNDSETSQTLTRTRNSRRGMPSGNEVVQTPVVPKTKKIESLLSECADEGNTGDQIAKEKQDIPKTPGVLLTSHKRETKEKTSVSQVRKSARLAAKRVKELSIQDNERMETIAFGDFSEAVTEGIDLKTASDESLDRNKTKEGTTNLSAENLNLLNKELKVDMPKSSEEFGKEKQDIPKTPGVLLASHKREITKDKSSVSQVRRSARLATKRMKELSKQDNERMETITFGDFSEAVPEDLDLKTASDEGKDTKNAKEGATDLSTFSYETVNLNMWNKELKAGMPKSSEELATGDNTNAIIENNVDMPLSNNSGVEKSSDEKAMELDNSLDVTPASFILAENSANNGLSAGNGSHYDECLNLPGSYNVGAGLQVSHVLPNENANKISKCEAGDADVTIDGYSNTIGLSAHTKSDGSDYFVDLPDKVIVSDDAIPPKPFKAISDYEGQQIACDDKVRSDNEDVLNTKEISGHEDETEATEISYALVESASKSKEFLQSVGEGLLDEFTSEDGELSSEEYTGDEDETNYEGLYYSEDEDATDAISESSDAEVDEEPNTEELSDFDGEDATDTSSESLDGEQSLVEFTDENEPNNEGFSYSKNKEATEPGIGSSGTKQTLGESAVNSAENKEVESKNTETLENKKWIPVQQHSTNSARKGSSALENVTEVPSAFLEPVVRQDDHTHISSGLAEKNSDHTIQMICSTPVKKKTPLSRMSGGVKCVSDDKENIGNSGRKPVRMSKMKMIKTGNVEENKKEQHEDKSRMNDCPPITKEATRPALQQLQDNCLVGDSANAFEG